jgi:hypothetical protein
MGDKVWRGGTGPTPVAAAIRLHRWFRRGSDQLERRSEHGPMNRAKA